MPLVTGSALSADTAELPAYQRPPPGMPLPPGIPPLPGMAKPRQIVWKMAGDKQIRPQDIHDDGAKTYILWGLDQDLPAVFALTANNQEQVVEGYMRGDVYVIDRVPPKLVFRIDNAKATAQRTVATK
ncbi:TrbG/VirB9 family P-type conjugative transfer protein [Parablastomonas sp. CN1-191]|uniref:TrbG/VirB9 family P-type conjugative transfer protein n=1 Tax=Parablastomonas sp. CN1-191 TaxID=3400908 RepID=UPI003BF89686